ncbi:MAG: precorrin-2 dehydrogenase/sirohydrochlorin ferrochelatase family protein [Zhaonellaceae bacterium]|jgi:precorrin-2 dehydrogenase/sirohydrochlorin ferrochelatase
MAMFPLFIDLQDKLCVVIGGGKVATRKVGSLAGFGAKIKVVSPKLTEQLEELERKKIIEVVKRGYHEGDLKGAFMAIAATSDKELNGKIHEYAIQHNIFVDVADCPQKCTFIFPSTVRRGDLIVGISTSGGYPTLAKRVRKTIDELLPREYGSMLEILKGFRSRASAEIKDQGKRKEMLGRIMDEAEKIVKEYSNEEDNQSWKP